MKAVFILSGSTSSANLAYWLKTRGYLDLICITYNYRQNQSAEIDSAKDIAKNLNAVHRIIDINADLANHNALIPYEYCTKDSKAITPDTTILLSIAWSIACEEQADILADGAYSGDHKADLDFCLNYFNAMNLALRSDTENSRKDNLELIVPFIQKTKVEIEHMANNFKSLSRENYGIV